MRALYLIFALVCSLLPANAQPQAKPDTSRHIVRNVTVDNGVTLEVLDWGGNGVPLILIPGLGSTAHTFDRFAERLKAHYRVYGVTRRGFGNSSVPQPTPENYDANRLGDDVLEVMASLGIQDPVLVGHSSGGSELSSIASRHGDRVSGLVYLEAGYSYALYVPDVPSAAEIDVVELRRELSRLPISQPSRLTEISHRVQALMKQLDRTISWYREWSPLAKDGPEDQSVTQQVVESVILGERKFTDVKLPSLVMYSIPGACDPSCDDPERVFWSKDHAAVASAVERAYSNAKVVRIPLGRHDIFRSNETEVVKEIISFISGLKK